MRLVDFILLIGIVQFGCGEDYGEYYDDDDYVITEDYEEQYRMNQMGKDAQEIHDQGLELAIAGNLGDALPLFARAAQLEENNHGFWSDLGVTQMRLNHLDDAKISFENAEKIKPGTELIRSNMIALQEHLDFRENLLRKEQETREIYDDEDDPYDDVADDDIEIMIDIDNYSSTVISSDEVWVLEYYSEKCGSCKEFVPTWHEMAESLTGLRLGRVNIDQKKGMELAKKHGVLNRGIPAIRVIHHKSGEGEIIMAGKLMDAITLKKKIHNVININSVKMDPNSGTWLKKSDEL